MSNSSKQPAHLAEGSVRKIGKKPPKFAAEASETLNPKVDKIKSLRKTSILLRFILITASVTFFSIAASIAIVELTLLPIVNVGGTHWMIERSSYSQGEAPIGAIAFNVGSPVQRSIASRFTLITSGAPSGSVVSVLALPLSVVSTNASKQVIINGATTNYYSTNPIAKHTLGNSYLVVCLKGSCPSNNTVIEVPTNQILGKVLGEVSLSLKLGSVPHPQGGMNVKP